MVIDIWSPPTQRELKQVGAEREKINIDTTRSSSLSRIVIISMRRTECYYDTVGREQLCVHFFCMERERDE